MQSASFRLKAINVPRIENAIGSLKTEELINSISWPGVNPISNIRLEDGWEESMFLIITFSPSFNCEADFICFILLFRFNLHKNSNDLSLSQDLYSSPLKSIIIIPITIYFSQVTKSYPK
jgi:hypothetical protein